MYVSRVNLTEENWSVNDFVARKQEIMLQAYASARSSLGVAASRHKRTYDFGVKNVEFRPQQRVWYYYPRQYMKRSKKFQFMYTGPYVVVKKLGAVNYLIRRSDRTPAIVVHADKLKACQDPLHVELCRVKRQTESLESCLLKPQCGSSENKVTCYVADSMETSTTSAKKGRGRRWAKKVKKPKEEGVEPPQPQTRQKHKCSTCQAEVWGYRPWKQHLRRCASRMAARSMEHLPAPESHQIMSITQTMPMGEMVYAPELESATSGQ